MDTTDEQQTEQLLMPLKHMYMPDTFTPVKILAVITDEDTMSFASQKLSVSGFVVSGVKSVGEAVKLLTKEDEEPNPIPLPRVFNWIIADVDAGLELFKITKEKRDLMNVPTLILVQSYSDHDLISKLYAAGASGLMTKDYFTDLSKTAGR